jgi:hypothetical protein
LTVDQDNSFMNVAAKPGEGGGSLTREVLSEFAGLYRQLSDVHGVNVSGWVCRDVPGDQKQPI